MALGSPGLTCLADCLASIGELAKGSESSCDNGTLGVGLVGLGLEVACIIGELAKESDSGCDSETLDIGLIGLGRPRPVCPIGELAKGSDSGCDKETLDIGFRGLAGLELVCLIGELRKGSDSGCDSGTLDLGLTGSAGLELVGLVGHGEAKGSDCGCDCGIARLENGSEDLPLDASPVLSADGSGLGEATKRDDSGTTSGESKGSKSSGDSKHVARESVRSMALGNAGDGRLRGLVSCW